MALTLDLSRLLAQLKALGAIGADSAGRGRTRIALTDEEKAGRDQLVAWMRELDLSVEVDRLGNIFGSLPRPRRRGIGSHSHDRLPH